MVPARNLRMTRHSSIPGEGGRACGLRASGRHTRMDAARFSPGRWVIVLSRFWAAARGAILWQWGTENGICVVLGTTWARLRALRCDVPPARCAHPCAYAVRSLSTCKSVPLAPESRRCRQCGRSSSPTACAASSSRLFLLPQPWAACLMVRAHGRAMRVDQRRIYVHGLRERAGYVTSLGTKPRRGCHQTHSASASSSR